MANSIREIFKPTNGEDTINTNYEPYTNTFGVDNLNINGADICFLRLDTSWCAYKGNDYKRNLRIGEYQLQKLYDEHIEKRVAKKKPILTIAISHHPLNLMKFDDEELCYRYFSHKCLDVNILMCGHIHDGEVKNYFNSNHSLLTLITGVGWHVDPDRDKESQRYSIYSVSPFRNSCEIIMRKSTKGGGFAYDYSIYADNFEDKISNKMSFPLKINQNHASITVNAPNDIEAKKFFLDNEILSELPVIVNTISKFSNDIAHIHEKRRQNGGNPKNFVSFLEEICNAAVNRLQGTLFHGNAKIRTHFRYYNKANDDYPSLCQSEKEDGKEIRTVKWDSLVKCAFDTKKPIILSANRSYSCIDPIATVWEDNITLIPHCISFKTEYQDSQDNKEERPILTFCLSIKDIQSNKDRQILYLLAHLNFDKILSDIIDCYIKEFGIKPEEFLNHIDESKSKVLCPSP